jgi:hypothetical protein
MEKYHVRTRDGYRLQEQMAKPSQDTAEQPQDGANPHQQDGAQQASPQQAGPQR